MSKYASLADLNKDKAAYYEALAMTLASAARNPEINDGAFRRFAVAGIPEFAEREDEVVAATTEAPAEGEAYFVGSDGESPQAIFFDQKGAFAGNSRYLDSFDQAGKPVRGYMRTEEGYTTDF